MKNLKRSCRGLMFVFSSTLVFGLGAMTVLEANSDAIDNFFNTNSTIIETTNDGTLYTAFTPEKEYLKEDGKADTQKLVDAHKKLGTQMSAEGSVLLKNNNNSLPLSKETPKVTLFGVRSSKLIAGAFIGHKASDNQTTSLRDALTENGIQVNNVMSDIFDKIATDHKVVENDYPSMPPYGKKFETKEATLEEIAAINPSYKDSYKNFNDAAIVVISRSASEGLDWLPNEELCASEGVKNPMQLTTKEKALIEEAKANFDNVSVIINSVSMMELGDLQNDEGIDSILWMGIAGNYGADGVAQIIKGKANPSGHLVDVYATSSVSAPAMKNFGDYKYSNPEGTFNRKPTNGKNDRYVVEAEGIYTGYRYYETRYFDSVYGKGNAKGTAGSIDGQAWDYTKEVTYPFGYGLSYTTFTQEIVGKPVATRTAHDYRYTVKVKVTNTGKTSGKDVVQVYGQAPYIDGGVEKSAIQLLGFDKTEILQPNQSETLTIEIDMQNLASWDSSAKNGNGSYILDQGNYYLSIGNGAHEALNNILAKQGKTTNDGMDAAGDGSKVFLFNEQTRNEDTFNITKSGAQVSNALENADYNYFKPNTIKHLTRSNWQDTFPIEYNNLEATEEMIKLIEGDVYTVKTEDDTSNIEFGKSGDLTFANMIGRPYDDPERDKLLSQLDPNEAINFILNGNRIWEKMDSVGFIGGRFTENGPNGVGDRALKVLSDNNFPENARPDWEVTKEDPNANFGMRVFPGATVVASTFNTDLAYEQGRLMGNDALFVGLPILWGPSMNTHRTGYNGRNIEYYSEDPYMTGIMGMEFSIGALDKGLIAAPKHFAFNDQETNRGGVAPYLTEQRGREIELRAFQLAFEATKYDEARDTDVGLLGVMTSFSKIGATEVTMHTGMITDILRNEWNYKGYIVSDLNDDYDQFEDVVAAGVTSWDTAKQDINKLGYTYEKYKNDAHLLTKIKDAVHHNLYILTKSNYMNTLNTSSTARWNMTWWRGLYIGIIATSATLAAATLGANIYLNFIKKDQTLKEEK